MLSTFISIDFDKTRPISLSDLTNIAADPKTPDDYAGYICDVLTAAKRATETIGQSLSVIKFGIHETGAIIPFGEGSHHAYSKHFYTEIKANDIVTLNRD